MYINHFVVEKPKKSIPLAELVKNGELGQPDAVVLNRFMGLSQVLRDGLLTYEKILYNTLYKLIHESDICRDSIRYIFYPHTSEDSGLISQSALSNVLRQLSLEHVHHMGGSSHKCATVTMHFYLANLLLSQLDENDCIILVLADITFTKILQFIPGATVMGDAGVGVILKRSGQHHRYIDQQITAYPKYCQAIWQAKEKEMSFQDNYKKYLVKLIIQLLNKSKRSISDIKIIFPHNVNKLSWLQVIECLDIPASKVYLENINRYGHCFGADPFLNLADACEKNYLNKGDFYILVNVGLGAVFSAMLFQY